MDEPILPSVQQWLDWKMTNVLPKSGGTLDQYADFMHDLRIILILENKVEKEMAEEREKEAKLQKGLADIREEIKKRTGR